MIIYSNSNLAFRRDVESNHIADIIEAGFIEKIGHRESPSEKAAWRNSMQYMERVLRNSQIAEDCGVLIEYTIPNTSCRVDFIVTGQNEKQEKNYVLVELKQWEHADTTDIPELVHTYVSGGFRDVHHPSFQADNYNRMMRLMNEGIYSNDIDGNPCVYLHNYTKKSPEPLLDNRYSEGIKRAPIYFIDDYLKLQDYLKKMVGAGKGMDILYEIEHGRIRPSMALVDCVDSLFTGNDEFILLDEQAVAYNTICRELDLADKKKTIIVKGGPGTGKSIISFKVLHQLIDKRMNAKFIAPNEAFREVMVKKLIGSKVDKAKNIKPLFGGSGTFYGVPQNTYDVLVVDECHHAVADSYKKIIEYFKPEFLLGLTATPERMDNQDVLELFDRNVPYELRLRDAIINDLIVPFHYYGIRDQLVDYGLPKAQERKMLAQLADAEHCSFIHDEIEKHRPEGKLKALVFCRNITHARQMSEALNEYYQTAYLTGKNTVGERIRAYNDLQDDHSNLEVLCSVDILNEGVDIPGVNMVVFLRPTESSTVFIQQLGRGLRKYDNKPYVTVLDFIGNSYKRSVQIALALGSLAQNLVLEKRLMMQLVKDDFKALDLADYGVEIHIDDLSKEEIVDYLEQENFNSLAYMKQDYENFKKYINSQDAPRHMDYLNNDCAPDLQRFMSIKIGGKKTGCYYEFLSGIEEENLPVFSLEQISFLKYASALLPLVRPHEFLILEALLHEPRTENELYD